MPLCLRVDSISLEWLTENKQNVDERHYIIIEHKSDEEVSQALTKLVQCGS